MSDRYYDQDAVWFDEDLNMIMKKRYKKDYKKINAVVIGSDVAITNGGEEETAKGLILAGLRHYMPDDASYALLKKIMEISNLYKKYHYDVVDKKELSQIDKMDAGLMIKDALIKFWSENHMCDYTADELEEIFFHALIHTNWSDDDARQGDNDGSGRECV